jgi:hypothetical protein
MHGLAVVRYAGMPCRDSSLAVEKTQFSFIRFIHAIELLHELQDIVLVMPICRQGGSYGNDFTQ